MTNLTVNTKDYSDLITDLKTLISQGQEQALSAVNKIRLETYWQMGKKMSEALASLDAVSASGMKAGSADFFSKISYDLNLDKTLVYRINQFYRTWPDAVPAIDGNFLSWASHVELLAIKNPDERNFYLETATKEDWLAGAGAEARRSLPPPVKSHEVGRQADGAGF